MNWLQRQAEQRRTRGLQRSLRPRQPGLVDIAFANENEAKSLFADYIVFKAKARKFIELLGMPYGQMWANEYELRAAKYFDFLLN